MNEKTCERNLIPGFDEIRLRESTRYWVVETLKDRYAFLTSLTFVINYPYHGRHRPISRGSNQIDRTNTPSGPPSMARTPPLHFFAPPPHIPQVETVVEALQVGSDDTILYKGGAIARLEGAVRSDGQVQIARLASTPPTDFERDAPSLSFTKQRECAEKYARWAAARNGTNEVPVGILYLFAPKCLLDDVVEIYGNELKEFVWCNRLDLDTSPSSGLR